MSSFLSRKRSEPVPEGQVVKAGDAYVSDQLDMSRSFFSTAAGEFKLRHLMLSSSASADPIRWLLRVYKHREPVNKLARSVVLSSATLTCYKDMSEQFPFRLSLSNVPGMIIAFDDEEQYSLWGDALKRACVVKDSILPSPEIQIPLSPLKTNISSISDSKSENTTGISPINRGVELVLSCNS
jgi:hypothetical protein